MAARPDLTVVGNETKPRRGAFEVTLDGKVLFSKIDSGRFPRQGEVLEALNSQ
eukprot:CAMPEP_0184669194 /NCGR_PEP_ID=MMETSP0308-20130426/76235_1 /TAXON_ID=38269 /ORGANISM="Gloeochaete witrockiana, Strain SAG 46.84" /LENGTH=52 /DNA_ID=CAMNT_0027115333 /DNA_START=123 /DNA_END=281 /DNA_ORIENTATION=-